MRAHRSASRVSRISRVLRVHAVACVLLVPALLLTGCTGGDGSGDGGSRAAEARTKAKTRDGAPGGKTAPARAAANHVIRTASLTVRVTDVPKALDRARRTTEAAGGYIGKESTTRDKEGRERTRVVLRVPVAKYGKVLDGLEGTGRLLDRHAQARDVTEQVVDAESRVKSQRASVARVRALMDDATKLGDVVKLEGELSSRQADLESLLARRDALKDRTDFATITLSLSGSSAAGGDGDDGPGFADALAGGWDAFVTMLRWVAMALGALLPFAAAAGLLLALWLRVVRPRLTRPVGGDEPEPEPEPEQAQESS
ncbi:DUF4349 domain-containing protein [Streptomyces sp. NPDC048172]|uniref:DUF4349 domain-containing protein n=1 Tax=Streptomyces sp. NPDC048172 TaxID=3365505 RepID=UPI003718AC04